MDDKELIKIIYQGDLERFIYKIGNRRLINAYENEVGYFNQRISKFFKDLTRRVTNPAYLEMLLCDLYGILTTYEFIQMLEGVYEYEEQSL